MHINENKEDYGSFIKKHTTITPDRIIHRPDKGIIMLFLPYRVIKDMSADPKNPLISRNGQTRRLKNEISAYKRFNELKCYFVPRLLDFSIENRWFAISRIHGKNLLELLGNNQCWSPIRTLLLQIDQMNLWLKRYKFGNMENCLKDLILEPSGKLFLVDFEPYSPKIQDLRDLDIYEPIIYDILERILIRSVRKVKLTKQFIFFAVNIILERPLKSLKLTVRCLRIEKKNAWWFVKINKILRILKNLF